MKKVSFILLLVLAMIVVVGCTNKPASEEPEVTSEPGQQQRMADEVEKAEKGEVTILGGWLVEGKDFDFVLLDEEGEFNTRNGNKYYDLGKWTQDGEDLILISNTDKSMDRHYKIVDHEEKKVELELGDGSTEVWTRRK